MVSRQRYILRGLLAILVLAPLLVGTYYAFASPRPYHLMMQTDIESDYYYNAKRLLAGEGVIGTYHPGTPVYYLGALIMRLSGDDSHQAQQFFNAAYMAIALITMAALSLTLWLLRRTRVPLGVAGLVVAAAMAWPPFLAYLNYFGSDAFIVAAGLPLLAFFWNSLHRYQRWRIAVLGAAAGACASIKLTFIPLAVALAAATSVQVLRRERWWWVATFPATATGAFALCTLPVLEYMPGVVLFTIADRGQAPARRIVSVPSQLADVSSLGEIAWLQATWPFLLLGICAALLLGRAYVRSWFRYPRRKLSRKAEEGFDNVAAGTFAVLGSLALGYFVAGMDWGASSAPIMDARNASPSALVVPFLLLMVWKSRAAPLLPYVRAEKSQGVLLLIAFALVAYPAVSYTLIRQDQVQHFRELAAAKRQGLQHEQPERARLAVWYPWQGMPEPAGFHFWGNYRYADEVFNRELLRAFPKRAMIRMRHLGLDSGTAPPSGFSSRKETHDSEGMLADDGWLNQTYHFLISHRGMSSRPVGPVVAQSAKEEVGTLAFAEAPSRPGVVALLRDRFGPLQVHRDTIAGDSWIIARLSSPPQSAVAP